MKYLKIFEADDIIHPVQPVIPGYLINKYFFCTNQNIPLLSATELDLCPMCKHEVKKLSENDFFKIVKETNPDDFEEMYHMIKYGMVHINSLPSPSEKKPEYKINVNDTKLSNDNPDDDYGYNEPN
jgi:hypothetical protein